MRVINQMCSRLSRCLNETPLGLQLPRAPGPSSLASAGAFFRGRSYQKLLQTGQATHGELGAGMPGPWLPPPRLRPPNPACPRPTLHLSHIISKAMHPSPANSVLKDFIFPLPNPLSSGHELPQSKGSKMCGQKQKHFHQTQEQEHLPASMGRVGQGEHSDRALGKKELGILLICQQVSGRHHGAQMGAWEVL